MNRDQLDKLQLFQNSTLLPIFILNQKQEINFLGTEHISKNLFRTLYQNTSFNSWYNDDFSISNKNSILMAKITPQNSDSTIILGPVLSTYKSDKEIFSVLQKLDVPKDSRLNIINFFHDYPAVTYEQLFFQSNLLSNYLFNGKIINVSSIYNNTKQKYEFFHRLHEKRIYAEKEANTYHNSYNFEEQLYNLVENGDTASLKKLNRNVPYLTVGKMSNNSLRQEKDLLLVSIALLARHSIKGGLPIEEAYKLSDSYIQRSEAAVEVNTIRALSQAAIFDFTSRVAKNKLPQHISPIIAKAVQYIRKYTNQPIGVTDVAQEVGLSRSYLSKIFKKEMGISINKYINMIKIEEAKHLLAYTDLALSEISTSLCFSSQSYFQKVFKNLTGQTPKEYRDTELHDF